MMRRFSVYPFRQIRQIGTPPTDVVKVIFPRNVHKSERLMQIMQRTMSELLGENVLGITRDARNNAFFTEIPEGLVPQNDDALVLRRQFYALFNRNRSLQDNENHEMV